MDFNTIEEALAAVRNGWMAVVVDDQDREHEGDLIASAELAASEVINFMVTHGKGLVCVPLGRSIIEHLDLQPMSVRNNDPMGTAFTVSVDHDQTSTGISAAERALTIQRLAASDARANEFHAPGHVFPLKAADGGVLSRPGHTEAAVDLARYAGLRPAAVICEILKEDGTMARTGDLFDFARQQDLPIISIEQLIEWRKGTHEFVVRDSVVHLPTDYGMFKLYTYYQYPSGEHHMALVMGDIEQFEQSESVLVRVHSECLTGDALHSLRCDCGDQLKRAMQLISEEGQGVLVYLRQEGRGIGFPSKMRAYSLQEQGYDTVEANVELGFAPDERKYYSGARILQDLNAVNIRLLTNNPEKITGLEQYGIRVKKRLPLVIAPTQANFAYLNVKSEKMGHLYKLDNASSQ